MQLKYTRQWHHEPDGHHQIASTLPTAALPRQSIFSSYYMLLSLLRTVVALLTSLQMDLQLKFAMATACRFIPIGCLEVDHLYPKNERRKGRYQVRPHCHTNRYAHSDKYRKGVYAYSLAFSDGDIEDINKERVYLHLRYEGTCPKSKSLKRYLTKCNKCLDAVSSRNTVLPKDPRCLRAYQTYTVGRGV
jgi:hypothetical protein